MSLKDSDLKNIKRTNDIDNLIQLKESDLNELRFILLKEQNNKCLICGDDVSLKSHIDHKHKRKSDPFGINGDGLIRGLLCPGCNNYLGKVENNQKRFKPRHSLLFILSNLIEYLKMNPYPLIHPREKIKEPKLSKRNFNKLKKISGLNLVFPKSQKLTKKLKPLYEKYDINPYN